MSGAPGSRIGDRVGRVLRNRYRLVALIGTGASGQVFLAEDVELHRRVAVKVLHPGLADDESFLRRFRAEARAAAALSHPNVMAVYDWGEDEEGPYLVLEHLGGGSLRAMLDAGHRLSLSQALLVGLEAARALEVAHRQGIVHRDIKPANLLFGDDARLRIADFGLARALSEASQSESSGSLVGTARYAAPEQARGTNIDGRADLYSLGLVLAEAVTGEVPLIRESALQTLVTRQDTPVPVSDQLGPLAPLLARMGRPDPAERPDATAVVAELLTVARVLDGPAPLTLVGSGAPAVGGALDDDLTLHVSHDTGVLPAVAKRRRRWPRALAALVLAVALAVGGSFAWSRLRTPSSTVPELAGVSREDAVARIDKAEDEHPDVRWRVTVDEEYSEGVDPDVVIRQNPPGLGRLDDGGTIHLVVSKGPPPVPVPDLSNKAQPDAAAALVAAGLALGAVESLHHEDVPKGIVLTWKAGGEERPTEAPKGSDVDLVVSGGPRPRVVPDVRGRSEGEARAAIEPLRLVVTVVEVFSDGVPAGQVVATSPPAGTQVARGSTVTIQKSKGPDLVSVPDVSDYESLDDAERALEAAGLHLGDVSGRGTRPAASDPSAGTMVARGTYVDVFLRRR